jgi:glycine/D-amino acid oxidase-like deaminating enzyme
MAMISSTPYWWQEAPPNLLPAVAVAGKCDVVIVGAGYTGLSAALALARAGRQVEVFDRQRPGEGASTRNGGIASGNLRPSYRQMVRRFGAARAAAIQAEAKAAREDLAQFIKREGIDCDFRLTGRFTGAANPDEYESLAREAELLRKTLKIDAYAIPRAQQKSVLGTDFYHGGMVRNDIGGLNPAKLHRGLLAAAQNAGAIVHANTAVYGFAPCDSGFSVETARGRVQARYVLLGTNGYTDQADRWLRRRLVPVRSRIIATAPLSNNLMSELMPKGVMCSETRKLHYYYRPSPDGTRILFGGRDGTIAGDPSWPTDSLRRALADIFPVLVDVDVTHSWYGYVAMNRDMIPRIFSRRGARYAAGYCGSGVVWARWAGQKAAWQILGEERGASALDFRPPPLVPLFNGTPWFLPAVYAWMSLQDRINASRRRRRPSQPAGANDMIRAGD